MNFEKMYQELYEDQVKKGTEMSKIIGYAKATIYSASIGLLTKNDLEEKYNNVEKMWNDLFKTEDNEKKD